MENKLSKIICEHLLSDNIIEKAYLEVYIYGMELLLSFLFSTGIILAIGIASGRWISTILFLVIFIALRRFTGGYHADTYLKCKLFTIGTYLAVMLLSEFSKVNTCWYLLLTIPGILVICKIGPVENPNKTLTWAEKKKHKFTSIILYCVSILFGINIRVISHTLSNVVCYTLIAIITLMILTNLKKGDSRNEETSC